MISMFRAIFLPLLFLARSGPAGATEPVISNMRAAQVAGTKLVEVSYDIGGGTPPYAVSLQGSADGGATWTLPVTTVSGDAGSGITAGPGRKIVWNAGTDWNGQVSDLVRFRVTALDVTTTVGDFALIPAGSFQMGDATGVGYSREIPVHMVTLSAFYMAKCETTKELWDSVRAWGLSNGYTDLEVGNGSYASKGANHPVHSVSWYDVVKWCNARSEMENLMPCYTVNGVTYRTDQTSPVCDFSANGYRLPTEAEWEKAARGGGAGQNFPWGNTITHSKANYNSLHAYQNENAYDVSDTHGFHPLYGSGEQPYTAPVDSFEINQYGLRNVVGNVWEWCWDWYGDYSGVPQDNPTGASIAATRIYRGGCWGDTSSRARLSFRDGWYDSGYPSLRVNVMGFRLARSSVP